MYLFLTKLFMKEISVKNVRLCGCCHRELAVDLFYFNKSTRLPDNYCKECRKKISTVRYRDSQAVEKTRNYPVITKIQDHGLRMAFILHALRVVRQSMMRKRERERERGWARECPDA